MVGDRAGRLAGLGQRQPEGFLEDDHQVTGLRRGPQQRRVRPCVDPGPGREHQSHGRCRRGGRAHFDRCRVVHDGDNCIAVQGGERIGSSSEWSEPGQDTDEQHRENRDDDASRDAPPRGPACGLRPRGQRRIAGLLAGAVMLLPRRTSRLGIGAPGPQREGDQAQTDADGDQQGCRVGRVPVPDRVQPGEQHPQRNDDKQETDAQPEPASGSHGTHHQARRASAEPAPGGFPPLRRPDRGGGQPDAGGVLERTGAAAENGPAGADSRPAQGRAPPRWVCRDGPQGRRYPVGRRSSRKAGLAPSGFRGRPSSVGVGPG
jgi:hypothetical protein